MFNVRLAGGHLNGKQLFTWLSLVVSLMASFVLSFFPLDVLDEIWHLVESVSEGFLTYSFIFSVVASGTSHYYSFVSFNGLAGVDFWHDYFGLGFASQAQAN